MKIFTSVVTVSLLLMSSLSFADDRTEDPIESRQNLMKNMGKSMKVLGPIYAYKIPFNVPIVMKSADSLVEHANTEYLLDSFPEGSLAEDSKSKIEIWNNWEEFSEMMSDLETNANNFKQVASMGLEDSVTAFKQLTESCSACHKKYRSKNNK